ncbi:c6 transcription [Diaporthe eres]|nr:c6 transcription [Diaporthe eres]
MNMKVPVFSDQSSDVAKGTGRRARPVRWSLWRSDRYAETQHQIMAGSIRVSLPDNESTAGAADEDSCGSQGGSPAEPRPRPQKRRRIPVACGACRSKKSRCDGSRPKCSSCQALNVECVYLAPPIATTTPVPRAFLQLVESRLSQLESDVRSLKSQQSEGGSVPDSVTVDRRPSFQIHQVPASFREPDSAESVVSPDATDGIGSIEFTKEDDSGYYGIEAWPSPSIILMRACPARPAAEESGSYADSSGPRNDCLSLPPDDEMDALVDRFFRDTGALFPFVHPYTFMETYRHTKSIGFRRSRRSWLGLLNSILAMSIFTSGSWSSTATGRGAKAEIFFTRAKALCLDQMLSGSSLETVQAMLLMSQYLQGTHRSVMTWNMHGIAVKAAFQLGLHSTTSLKAYTPLERETRTRTWFACVMLDRTLSMTFGRPPAIPDSYIRTPLPQPYSGTDILPTAEVSVDDAMSIHFFVSTITLYKVMWTIIDRLYDCNIAYPDNSVISTASQILEIEHQLLEWQASLPPLLSLTNASEIRNDNDFCLARRFRVILTLRHHNVRLLAHRRIFDLYLASIERGRGYDAYESMLIQIGERSKNVCLQTASELISIVNVVTHSPQPKCGLLALNAALTIVTMALCNHANSPVPAAPCEAGGISDQALRDALADALACLPLIDKGNRMVDKCAKFVATLQQCLNLLDQTGPEDSAPARSGANGHMPLGAPRGSQNGQYPYVPVPIDAVNLDLTALGWETEGFLSSLNAGFMEGFQDADLFC